MVPRYHPYAKCATHPPGVRLIRSSTHSNNLSACRIPLPIPMQDVLTRNSYSFQASLRTDPPSYNTGGSSLWVMDPFGSCRALLLPTRIATWSGAVELSVMPCSYTLQVRVRWARTRGCLGQGRLAWDQGGGRAWRVRTAIALTQTYQPSRLLRRSPVGAGGRSSVCQHVA